MLKNSFTCLVACVLLACSADRTPKGNGTVEDVSAITVGPAGLTLDLPDRAKLVIPEGALLSAIGIGFHTVPKRGLPQLPPGMEAVSSIYELTPHGLQFEKSVQMTLPHKAMTPKGLFLLRLDDADDKAWDIVTAPTTITAESVSLRLNRFSYYVVVRYVLDGGMPEVDGSVGPPCGNGKVDPGEMCDDGTNNGAYGGCEADCMSLASYCGDGEVDEQAGEACDDGINSGAYGGCAQNCKRGPYCGDGQVDESGNEICDDGVNDNGYDGCSENCMELAPHCGDEQVDPAFGEYCDPSESCPSADGCTSVDACIVPMFSGSADDCSAQCDLTTVISACENDDGCCPSACNSRTDNDCSATCGNGVIESASGETCEPSVGVGCPASCDDGNPCTLDVHTGTAENCNVVCTHPPVQVGSADGCCLPGANANNDADCTPVCGNGARELGEVCDSNCPTSCPDPDPADGCVGARLVGNPSACTSACETTLITRLSNGDGCCPGNSTYTQDTDCPVMCGDGRVEGNEVCDDGLNNGSYGTCNPGCRTRAAYCGDDLVNGSEVCDDGVNNGSYGTCNPGCRALAPYCGDGIVNGTEVCDDSVNDGSYGGCLSGCRARAPYCGDGLVTGPEVCDDGTNNGAYGGCMRGCRTRAPYCGDGTVNGPEVCDDGTNNGAYGGCMSGCRTRAPYCGDGTVNGTEVCDDGTNNGAYGGCMSGCRTRAPYCGDGTVNGTEVCDDGTNNGAYGGCMSGCRTRAPYCGDGTVNGTEVCDDGTNNGAYGGCMSGCLARAPYCGDGIVTAPEVCDDEDNDGSYGTCNPGCRTRPSYCGDGEVDRQNNESCDSGANNGMPGMCNTRCSGTVPIDPQG